MMLSMRVIISVAICIFCYFGNLFVTASTVRRRDTELQGFGGSPDENNLPLQRCQGDCDVDDDCDEGLVCWQRDRLEAVPGCEGGEEADSRTDYCIDESYVNGGSSNTDLNYDNNSNAYPVIINGLDVAGESYVDIYPEERTSGGGNDFMSNYNLPVASTSTDSSGNKEPVEQKNDASSDNNNRIPPRDYIPITPESEIPSESSSVISPISLWKLGTSRCTLFSVVLAIALILT